MTDYGRQSANADLGEGKSPLAAVENNRRKLITKLAAGAFAVPAVLATLSTTPAHAS